MIIEGLSILASRSTVNHHPQVDRADRGTLLHAEASLLLDLPHLELWRSLLCVGFFWVSLRLTRRKHVF